MSSLIVLFALVLYLVFYFGFGKKLQKDILVSQEAPEAPSKRLYDGVDYIPTNKFVLFGHHFASIAGAGPIVGPSLAIVWGWLPGLLWVWFGNIFIGAIHDYLSMTASVRYDGRSVQFISQDLIGEKAGKTFGWFIMFLSLLVVAAFGNIVVTQFVADGSVATTFFLFCLTALVLGFLLYRTKIPFSVSTILGIIMLVAVFFIGRYLPIKAGANTWYAVIFIYVIVASSLPVNVLLQPRDYLNSFLLYFGLFIGGVAALFSFTALDSVPAITTFAPKLLGGKATPFWPTIPLIIACGALSGFHSIIASGTTSKQLEDEKEALFIGYGAMLTEGFLATIAVVAIAAFGEQALGDKLMSTGALGRFTNSFGEMVSSVLPFFSKSFMALFASVWVSSFALTTLDTTTRLGRYIIGELALPIKEKNPALFGFLSNKWMGSFITAFCGLGLAWTGSYTILWPAFSGANQLIGSIAMLTAAIWVKKKLDPKYTKMVFIPAMLLWVTVTAGIIWYTAVVVPNHFVDMANVRSVITGVVVGIINIFMLGMNIVFIVQFFKRFKEA